MIGSNILAAGRIHLGVPWRHLGRTPAGLDCIGLVLLAAEAAGLTLEDPAPYAREPSSQRLRQGIAEHLDAVPLDTLADGDLLMFNMGLYAGHLGLSGTHPAYAAASVLHAYLPRRAVVEELLEPMRASLTGAYRWRQG